MSNQALNGWKRIGGYEAGYQDGLADSSAALLSLSTALTLSMLLWNKCRGFEKWNDCVNFRSFSFAITQRFQLFQFNFSILSQNFWL